MQIREHLALRNFSLRHSNQEVFVSCKCNGRTSYLIWRAFWAIYHCSWLMGNLVLVSINDDLSVAKWFIYLSNWVYVVLTIECVLETVIVIATWNEKPPESNQDERLPWYIQVMWVLYTISVVGSVMVSVWYWTFIHKGKELTAVRFNTHAITSIYVILNMAVTRVPLRLLHFLYPVAFGCTYTLFSAVYYSLGGTNQYGDAYIYSILDWSKAGRTLAVSSLSNFVFIPIVHVLMWALSLCFQKMYDRIRHRGVVYNQALDREDTEVDIS